MESGGVLGHVGEDRDLCGGWVLVGDEDKNGSRPVKSTGRVV